MSQRRGEHVGGRGCGWAGGCMEGAVIQLLIAVSQASSTPRVGMPFQGTA